MPHRYSTVAALIGLVAFAGTAQAGEHFVQSGWSGENLPSMTRWGDTYAGSVAAVSFRHGTYFAIDRNARPDFAPPEKRQAARIIDTRTAHCRYEAGVCVIRP